jgi:hypothetical protein
MNVRAAEATYLKWLAAEVPGAQLLAVRVGGGPLGELRYPDSSYNGHTDCFWAYDKSSQAASPVPGWAPGTGSTADATKFLTAYNNNLTGFGDWLDAQMGADFRVPELVLLPGWGERPGAAAGEISSRLTEGLQEFSEGLDWAALLPSLPRRDQSIAYTTYLDSPSFSGSLQREDPADFISSIAGPLQMRMGGESSVGGTETDLNLMVGRALRLHLVVVDWMDEASVVQISSSHAPGYPDFADLAMAAATLAHA